MAVFDHARRCLRRRLSVVMVGRRACRMPLRCRFIVVVMVIAHLHGGPRLGWRVVVRWSAGWMLVARSFGCLVVMVGGDALPIGMGLRFTADACADAPARLLCPVFTFTERQQRLEDRSAI